MRSPALAFLLLASAPACSEPYEPPTTREFSPAEIGILAELRTNGGTAQVLATLIGDGMWIELASPDRLTFAEAGGPEVPLVAADARYVAQIETSATQFELVLSRGDERAVTNLVTPPPFLLSGPSTTVSRASPIPITWDVASAGAFETWVEVAAACLSYPILRHFSQDIGAYEIQPADLALAPGTAECDFRVWVTRVVPSGGVAAGPGAPTPGAEQVRSIVISTEP
ncbi:hypothetical protein [Polyangium spumosum]|uniref:Uncharacterized protein n=1 Tax=Polyangium spumosum TaxID=889282 RepID=A0A6N7PJ29_9BACT|nr:hypothetical protein [Polyangium spumosum]MRG91998.1 hypothetical protein [Polyangium spumosum]